MWDTLGHGLVASFECGDISTLARAHGGVAATQIARLAVGIWAEHVIYTQLAQELFQQAFTESVLRTAVRHYGQQSLACLRDDPYRLLAFAELGPVDQTASERFGIRMNDHRRLMGLVDAAVYALYDVGIAIFSRKQLETTIHRLAGLQCQQVVDAINLALAHGRLVATTECRLMGEGFARIERIVIQHFANRNQSTPELTPAESCTNTDSMCKIGRIAFEAADEQVAIILAFEEAAALKFVQCLIDLFSSQDRRCYILAGSDALCQRIHAATGLRATALGRGVGDDLVKSGGIQLRRSIVIVSSTIDFVAMAQLLPQLRPTDRLFFVGQPLWHEGDRAMLLPALLTIDQIFRRELPPSSGDYFAVDGASRDVPVPSATWRVYDPSKSEHRGVFWICVADDAFERAVVGVSHQLRRHGSVAIVTRDGQERQCYRGLIDKTLAETAVTIGHGTVSVVTADAIEPGDSASSVVVLRHPEARCAAWLNAALGTAATRAVVVSTVGLDCELSTMEDDKSAVSGFVTRWRHVTAEQEQAGERE